MYPMHPNWFFSDPFADMLLKYRSLRIAAFAVVVLILIGRQISRSRPRLLEKGHLKRKVLVVFDQAVPSLRRLPCVLSFAAAIAGIALIAKALHVRGLQWAYVVQILLQISLTSPIARGLSLTAIVAGGLMLNFAKTDSKLTWARIILGLGMAIGAVNFLSISIVQN